MAVNPRVKFVQRWLVLVKLPRQLNVAFDQWASVGQVSATDPGDAISRAVNGAPSLLEYVPAGVMSFLALPLAEVKMHHCLVSEKSSGGQVERS